MNQSLCLHTGGNTVDMSAILKVPTPMATQSHVPLAHHDLIVLAKEALNDAGWIIRSESHALAAGGMNYFGLMEIDRVRLEGRRDSGITIGLRNSHIKQFRAGLCAGSRVFVCDNLAFWGEVTISRKHTTNIMRDISPLMALAVGKLMNARIADEQRVAAYQRTELETNFAEHLMMTMIRLGVIPPSKIGMVLEDYEHPERKHQEFVQYRNSVYGLYMATTEHLKGNLFALPKRSAKLHVLLDGAAQFTDGLTLEGVGVDAGEVEMEDYAAA